MKSALLLIVLAGIVWISVDSPIQREFKMAKQEVLDKVCPASNGSTTCHLLTLLLYDP